jgi:hypothetical protein
LKLKWKTRSSGSNNDLYASMLESNVSVGDTCKEIGFIAMVQMMRMKL